MSAVTVLVACCPWCNAELARLSGDVEKVTGHLRCPNRRCGGWIDFEVAVKNQRAVVG